MNALVWRSAASPLSTACSSCSSPPVSSSSSSSSSSSLLHVRIADRRVAAGLVLLDWPCASPRLPRHSRWLDASAVTLVRHIADRDAADALLGRGAHEPPFEDENDAQLRLYESPRLGRVVAAHRRIPAGACAMRATAFAVVVSDRSVRARCHWCFAQLTKKAFRCGGCEFALYCSRPCLEADAVLHDPQCSPLRDLHTAAWAHNAVLDKETLRLALAVLAMEVFVANPDALAKLSTPTAPAREASLDQAAQWLRRSLKRIPNKASALRVVKRTHIRETLERIQSNAHPLLLNGTSGVCGLGVFPEAAMTLNHSCAPNVVPSFDPVTRSLQLYAVADIQPLELIEYSYLSDLMVGRARRLETLREGFGFDCECRRCVRDATGTLAVDGSNQEEQHLLRQLVQLSGENDPLAVSGRLRVLTKRHETLLGSRPDVAFSLKMLELRSATQTNDWAKALMLAETLLRLWESEGLPKSYPTTETLHQQIAVAAMRLGDGKRAQEAITRVAEIQKVCGFQAFSAVTTA